MYVLFLRLYLKFALSFISQKSPAKTMGTENVDYEFFDFGTLSPKIRFKLLGISLRNKIYLNRHYPARFLAIDHLKYY